MRTAKKFIVFALALCLLIVTSAKACLTPEQNSTLLNLSLAANTSFESLYSIFSTLCENIKEVNQTALTDTTNLNTYYNKTEVESLLPDDYANQTQLETLEAKVNWNFSQAIFKSDWLTTNQSLWQSLQNREDFITDVMDEKISGMRNEYASKSDFSNITNTTALMWQYILTKPSIMKIYAPYIFWIAVAAMAIATVTYKYGPQWLIKPFTLKGVKGETRTADELVTESDLKRRIERLRELKLQIVRMKAEKAIKAQLLKKVDSREIESLEEAKKELEILKAM